MTTKNFFAILIFISSTILLNDVCVANIAHGVKVIVIDAGHGGTRPGAHSRGVNEKDLNLKIALRLGKLIETGIPNIKVVYTRKTDIQLAGANSADLKARADLANKAKGDLFISIHANSVDAPSVVGVETFIMGESTSAERASGLAIYAHHKEELMDMSNVETAASVRAYVDNLKHLYGDYSRDAAKSMQQNYSNYKARKCRGVKSRPFMVLYNLDMPGILTEIGFMTNPTELAYMNSAIGQRDIARSLFDGIQDYVEHVERYSSNIEYNSEPTTNTTASSTKSSTSNSTKSSAVNTTKSSTSNSTKSAVKYTIQIGASTKSTPLSSPEFAKYKNNVKEYRGSGTFRYKYCVGEYSQYSDAVRVLKDVKKKIPGAFIVRCQGDKIVN